MNGVNYAGIDDDEVAVNKNQQEQSGDFQVVELGDDAGTSLWAEWNYVF